MELSCRRNHVQLDIELCLDFACDGRQSAQIILLRNNRTVAGEVDADAVKD